MGKRSVLDDEVVFLGREEVGRIAVAQVELGVLPRTSHAAIMGESDLRVARWWKANSATGGADRKQVLPSLVSWYDPMTVRTLPFELAALAPVRHQARSRLRPVADEQPVLDAEGSLDQGDVLRFYRDRGPLYYLGQEVVEVDANARPTRPGVRRFEETCARVGGDPFWWIRQQAKEMWVLLELWQAWRRQDVGRLQRLLGPVQSRLPVRPLHGVRSKSEKAAWEPDEWWRLSPAQQRDRLAERRKRAWPEPACGVAGVTWTGDCLQAWVGAMGRAYQSIPGWLVTPDIPPQYLAPMSEDDCLHYAWQIIRERVEHHLQDVAPSLALTGNGDPAVRMALRYGTLLEATYLHLRRMIGGADRIGRCRECGQLYLQGREDKEFCSPQHANTYWRRERRRSSKH